LGDWGRPFLFSALSASFVSATFSASSAGASFVSAATSFASFSCSAFLTSGFHFFVHIIKVRI
jgi:hypothetical protein